MRALKTNRIKLLTSESRSFAERSKIPPSTDFICSCVIIGFARGSKIDAAAGVVDLGLDCPAYAFQRASPLLGYGCVEFGSNPSRAIW